MKEFLLVLAPLAGAVLAAIWPNERTRPWLLPAVGLIHTVLAFWMLVNPPWLIVAAHHSGGQWLFLLIFALISSLAPFSFYFAGLQHLEPTRAIVASCLEPVFAIVIAAIALGDIMRPWQAAGIVLVLAAIVVVQMPDRAAHEPAALVEPIE